MKKIRKYIASGYIGYNMVGKKYKSYCLMFGVGIFILSSLNSCRKLINENPAGAQLLTSDVFKDSVNVQATLNGLYYKLAASGPYTYSLSTLPGLSADELSYVGTNYDTFISNTLQSTNADVESIWSPSYNIIYNANNIINNVPNSGGISASFKNQAVGEALFVRALCYFYLTNLYGDVPLILGTNLTQNSAAARTPSATVYSQMVNDLKLAESYLRTDYSISGNNRTRANKYTAAALLARVYLYQKDWKDAATEASTVISSSLFSLPDDLTKVFTANSQEAILQLYNQNSSFTYYAGVVIPNPVTLTPTYVLTTQQLNAFLPGDTRKTNWTNSVVYSGTTYYYPYKYKTISGSSSEYFVVLRLAEQYLIRAEAENESDPRNASAAIADLNMIHNTHRVGLAPYSGATDQVSVRTAIMNERQVELFSEWGHRWLDLKRTNTANTVLQAEKPTTWKPNAVLYPIPQTEVLNDPNLVQNPGY